MISNRYLDPFQSARSRGLAVIVLVGIGMLLDVAGVGVGLSQASFLSDIAAGRSVVQADVEASDARVQLVGILTLLVFVATVVAFLIWIHRAYRNLETFGVAGLEYSPGWAIGGFFVPILNLIRPFQVVREIWKASNPDPDYQNAMSWQYSGTSPLVGAWWGTWIASGVLGRLVFSVSSNAKTADALLSATHLSVVGDILNLVPAVLVIMLIVSIDKKQEQKHERLKSLWAQQSEQGQPTAELVDRGSAAE